jgi:cytoskeletal protein CcmA (bactofilin family)
MGFISNKPKKLSNSGNDIDNFYSSQGISSEKTIIGKTLKIEGEVKSDEDVIIEGKVSGKVEVGKTLTIGKHGYVNAEISARIVRILGKVEGNVKAIYKVEIVPEGKLYGNIKAPKIVIAEGALFKGSVEMNDNKDLLNKNNALETSKTTPIGNNKSEKNNNSKNSL